MRAPSIPKLFLCCILAVFFNSCNGPVEDDARNIFRYNESLGIISLDPSQARDKTMIWPALQLFNGLVQMNDQLEVIPAIAHSWEITGNGTVYTFFLRRDVFFHDHRIFPGGKGRVVTAFDVEYSFNRILDPRIASPGRWVFNMLDTRIENRQGFQAVNDSVFRIWLTEPFPPFLGILTMPYCSVLPRELLDHTEVDISVEPVGTGPFYFKQWRRDEKLVLLKNPNYFEFDSAGNRLPYLDGVSISFIRDKQSEFMEFLLGNIDFLSGLHAVYKDELTTRNGNLNPKYKDRFILDTQPYLNTEYLGFLSDPASPELSASPVNDINFRKAVNFGFDRSKMLKYLRNNMGTPANYGFLPAGLPFHNQRDVKGYDYNPDSARYYLTKAGYPPGTRVPEVSLTTTSDYLDLCEFIQYELSRFGIRINLEVATGGAYRNKMANGHLLFFRGSWIADYPDPENYLSLFYSPNRSPAGPNYTRFGNESYDSLYQKSLQTSDPMIRAELNTRMDQFITENAVVVPLFYDEVVRFYPIFIKGLHSNPLNMLVIKYVEKTR